MNMDAKILQNNTAKYKKIVHKIGCIPAYNLFQKQEINNFNSHN